MIISNGFSIWIDFFYKIKQYSIPQNIIGYECSDEHLIQKNKKESKDRVATHKPTHRAVKVKPYGFCKKNLHPTGSIFYCKNLDSPALATLKIGFLFLFFSRFFFCFLLKKCAKRSEQKFNGSYYANAKHQIAQARK